MPKALERKLKKRVAKKKWPKKRQDAYIFGTLRKTGWTPSTQKKKKRTKRVAKRLLKKVK